MSIVKEKKGTRFIWKIENFSCWDNRMLQSPWFISYTTTWEVRIRRGQGYDVNYMDFELCQEKKVAETFNCSIALLDLEGSPLIWREKKNCQTDFSNYFRVCSIFKKDIDFMKEKLLPNDILTVECRIWQTADELILTKSCLCRTHIEPVSEVTEKTFTLKTAGVTSLQPGNIKKGVYSMTRLGDTVKIRLFFNKDEEIQAELTLSLVRTFAKCKISLFDSMGKLIQFADGEYDFYSKSLKWLIGTHITKDMLRCNQLMFLPNDTLTLVFAFTFSCKVTFNRIVEENGTLFFNPQTRANNNAAIGSSVENEKLNESSKELEPSNRSKPPGTINQVLQSMYEAGFMSDFSLRVGDRTFPVHKNILGARSSVFEAMFSVDMKEKASGSVDIPDVDADTIQRMLKFVYCDSVEEDLQWESVSNLYSAADKYALEPLKQRCSDILKSELCASSVIGILLLATKYQEQDLKVAALEFIARNDKLIIGTEPWCKFEEDNPQIAIDVLRKLYVKKMNV